MVIKFNEISYANLAWLDKPNVNIRLLKNKSVLFNKQKLPKYKHRTHSQSRQLYGASCKSLTR